MKTELQKYERQTEKIVGISATGVMIGAVIWFLWSSLGAVLVLAGVGGLAWAFLRR